MLPGLNVRNCHAKLLLPIWTYHLADSSTDYCTSKMKWVKDEEEREQKVTTSDQEEASKGMSYWMAWSHFFSTDFMLLTPN